MLHINNLVLFSNTNSSPKPQRTHKSWTSHHFCLLKLQECKYLFAFPLLIVLEHWYVNNNAYSTPAAESFYFTSKPPVPKVSRRYISQDNIQKQYTLHVDSLDLSALDIQEYPEWCRTKSGSETRGLSRLCIHVPIHFPILTGQMHLTAESLIIVLPSLTKMLTKLNPRSRLVFFSVVALLFLIFAFMFFFNNAIYLLQGSWHVLMDLFLDSYITVQSDLFLG